MLKRKVWILVTGAAIVSMLLAACGGGETVYVEVTSESGGETVVVTATPPPPPPPQGLESDDPTTFNVVTSGDIDTLDPGWNYENVGGMFIDLTHDNLVNYVGPDATQFAGEVATDWDISEDGTTYTFYIREGITFHNGDALTPEDVAYTFQRNLLQGGYWSPQWLYTEPFFGTGIYDIAELVNADVADDPEGLQAEDPAVLQQVCEDFVSMITYDNDAGTVTFQLSQPWGPFIATMAGYWGAILDKPWAIEQGAWDGDCATWQNYYGVSSETAPLRAIENGSGPFILDHWTPGEEVVLTANHDYWLTEPLFEGGHTGPPMFERLVRTSVDEWGTRFAMLQAGDADAVQVPRENVSQVDPMVGEWCDYVDFETWDCHETDNPEGPLRLWIGAPNTARTDAFFVFDINDEGGNPYVGSGELDGNGIPTDFFSDLDVRQGFNYCFDWDVYIADVLAGEGVQNFGPINAGLIGYDENAPHYYYDLELCAEHLAAAWDGAVAENGFRFQSTYNSGNATRQSINEILQDNLAAVDPNYTMEIVGLPWPSFLAAVRASRVPIFVSGWGEDIHDPHNWAQPFLVGTYAHRQVMPDWMGEEFGALVSEGVAGLTQEARAATYLQIQLLDYEYAPAIRLAVATTRTYQPRWVKGWFYNPMQDQQWYHESKD